MHSLCRSSKWANHSGAYVERADSLERDLEFVIAKYSVALFKSKAIWNVVLRISGKEYGRCIQNEPLLCLAKTDLFAMRFILTTLTIVWSMSWMMRRIGNDESEPR